jgi:tRNA(Arg) A34 adenosine deaminase TadA
MSDPVVKNSKEQPKSPWWASDAWEKETLWLGDDAKRSLGEVQKYLDESQARFEVGSQPYFGRLALEYAGSALLKGNYPIGAVAVVREGDQVAAFRGENSLFSGNEALGTLNDSLRRITQAVGHAEMVALMTSLADLPPEQTLSVREHSPLADLREGLTMFGTLEPCPMCATAMTADRRVADSVSNALDPLGAYVIDPQRRAVQQPQVQTWIQEARNLRFRLLDSDPRLTELSGRVFDACRQDLDARIAQTNK